MVERLSINFPMMRTDTDPEGPFVRYSDYEAMQVERDQLRTGIKRLSDEEELCAETTGDDPFSLVYLAAKLAKAEAENKQLRADTKLLDAIQHESWDLRCFNIPTGGDDCDIGWSVIGHWQAEPHERVVAEIYHDDPRAAIRAAIGSREPISSDIDQRALAVADVIVRQMMDRGALLAVRNIDDELVPMDLDRQFQVKAGWQTAIAAALKSGRRP